MSTDTEQVTISRAAYDHLRVQISMLKDDLHHALEENKKLKEQAEGVRPIAWMILCGNGAYTHATSNRDVLAEWEKSDVADEIIPLFPHTCPPVKAQVPEDVIRTIWRAAITAANNICVGRSDRWNDEDGPCDRINEAAECAKEIVNWIEPDAFMEEIRNMLAASKERRTSHV